MHNMINSLINKNDKERGLLAFSVFILCLLILCLGLMNAAETNIAVFYYSLVFIFAVTAYFIPIKLIKAILAFLFLSSIIAGTQIFLNCAEQFEEFYLTIPFILFLIFPDKQYINILSVPLALTYFLNPGEEELSSIVEDALELIIIAGLVTFVSFQYNRIKKQVSLLIYKNYHDSITGLPNRTALEKHVDLLIQRNPSENEFSLLTIEVSGIRNITNHYGFEFGEVLLKDISERLKYVINESGDLFYMYFGEFAVVLQGNALDQLDKLLTIIIDESLKPFEIRNINIYIKIAIGGVHFKEGTGSFHSLYKKSSFAMVEAKTQKGKPFFMYNDLLGAKNEEKKILVEELKEAIIHDHLYMCYQPKNQILDNQLIGLEALVRWEHEERGQISPATFIPLAEEAGLISDLGFLIFQKVCKFISEYTKKGYNIPKISVNLSPHQLTHPDLLKKITQTMDQNKVQAHILGFEITEGVIMENPEKSMSVLRQLRNMGFSISMDDFGIGYSSFSYVKKMPLDVIKLDRLFVNDIVQDIKSQQIVRAMISMAKNLDFKVLAEGVETEEQCSILKEMGCDAYQGYYMSKPLPENEILKLL